MSSNKKKKTINRDAGDKAKGPRLQKLRAVILMLDSCNPTLGKTHSYCAVETEEDVHFNNVSLLETFIYLEQDKELSTDRTLTYLNEEVGKGVTNFIDVWIAKLFSKCVIFGFYATSEIGKEKQTKDLSQLGVSLPEKPLLEILNTGDYEKPQNLELLKRLTIKNYESEYLGKQEVGNLDVIKSWDDTQWKSFFDQIRWKFGEENVFDAKETALGKIRECAFFNKGLEGKEEIVLAVLLEQFDEKQMLKDPVQRFVHRSDIEMIFMRVGSNNYRPIDPTSEEFDKLPLSDKRNIDQKFSAVCADYKEKEKFKYSIKVSASLAEQREVLNQKSLKALKFQIIQACLDDIDSFVAKNNGKNIPKEQLEKYLDNLFVIAKERMENRNKDFQYPFSNDASIKGILLELFDSCYFALDKVDG
jgi:hypothetical protein